MNHRVETRNGLRSTSSDEHLLDRMVYLGELNGNTTRNESYHGGYFSFLIHAEAHVWCPIRFARTIRVICEYAQEYRSS